MFEAGVGDRCACVSVDRAGVDTSVGDLYSHNHKLYRSLYSDFS